MTDHPDRSKSDDAVIARLRSALDELTAGAGERTVLDPDATIPVRPVRQGRRYRWLVPTLAAAALIAVLVGVALRPEQHTTTPADSVPETPAPQPTIPWYELDLPGYTSDGPAAVGTIENPPHVYAAADYSQVLSISVSPSQPGEKPWADWEQMEAIPGMSVGQAWLIAATPESGDDWRGIYWFTGAEHVLIQGAGFSGEDLVQLAPGFELIQEPTGVVVASPLSSMTPLAAPTEAGTAYTDSYSVAGDPNSFVMLSVGGPGPGPLITKAMVGTTIAPMDTQFGRALSFSGGGLSTVLWPVTGTEFWASVTTNSELIDEAVASVWQTEPIPPPQPVPAPAPLDTANVPRSTVVRIPSVGVETIPVPVTIAEPAEPAVSKYVLDIDTTHQTDTQKVTAPPAIVLSAADDYSQVLTLAFTGIKASESTLPAKTDATPIDGMSDGQAWLLALQLSEGRLLPARQVYWIPSRGDAIVLSGYGFSPDELADIARSLRREGSAMTVRTGAYGTVGHTGDWQSSLVQTDTYDLGDGVVATLTSDPDGIARALASAAVSADSIEPARTPFGSGVRITGGDYTAVWWTDDTGMDTGLWAPTDQIDRLLQLVQVS